MDAVRWPIKQAGNVDYRGTSARRRSMTSHRGVTPWCSTDATMTSVSSLLRGTSPGAVSDAE